MSPENSSLTGSLPPLTEGDDDFETSTHRAKVLLEQAASRPGYDERASQIDNYVTQKAERLSQIRHIVRLSQVQVAKEMGVSQPDISKLEGRGTHMVDTIARFVEATGGKLRMLVEYDDGTVVEYTPEQSQNLEVR